MSVVLGHRRRYEHELADVPLLEEFLLREHDVATYEHCLSVGLYAQRLAIALGMQPVFASILVSRQMCIQRKSRFVSGNVDGSNAAAAKPAS